MASKELNFNMQHQQQDEWCWSATSTSTSLFYNPKSSWTQCTLVNSAFGQTTCCQDGSSASCNHSWYLDRALTITGNYVSYAGNPATMSTIESEIDGGRPLGWRIGWSGGGGHFGMVSGYDSRASTIDIRDPWYGNSEDLPYNTFVSHYQGSGSWTGSYFTKA